MVIFEARQPALYMVYTNRNFMRQKSRLAFSQTPHEQMSEQFIDYLKDHCNDIHRLFKISYL